MEKTLNRKYAIGQFLYFSMFAAMIAFVSVFLLHKGFDNATIGTVLSITGLASIGVQTFLANYIDEHEELQLQNVLLVLILIVIICSVLLFFVSNRFLILALIITIFSIAQAMLTFVNSLAFIYEKFGIKINYGLARGMGSLAYAVMTMVIGQVVEATTPDLLPFFYTVFAILLFISIRSYFLPEDQQVVVEEVEEPLAEQLASDKSMFSFIVKYKKLMFLMIGVIFLFFAHTLINNFLIQIITPIGGNSALMGRAVFVSAIVELPAMMNFNNIAKKVSIGRLLKISAIFFLGKHLLTYFATNMFMIYVAQFLQIGAFALATPAFVEYINSIVSVQDLVKGQSLLTTAMAASSVFASFLGGRLLDSIGVSQTLFLGVITTVIGVVIVFLAAEETSTLQESID